MKHGLGTGVVGKRCKSRDQPPPDAHTHEDKIPRSPKISPKSMLKKQDVAIKVSLPVGVEVDNNDLAAVDDGVELLSASHNLHHLGGLEKISTKKGGKISVRV